MRTAFVAAVLASLASMALAQQYVWWEAEKPSATNFPPAQKGDAKEQDVLSDGMWIGVMQDRADTQFLEYRVQVPATGEYDLFSRKFWKHGPFRWRFDDQPWQEVTKDCTLLDTVEIRTHWGANWVPAGSVKLAAGEHTMRLELTENKGVAYFDAFLLTASPFSPRGKLKPDAPFPAAPEGWVNFDPGIDTFGPSPIDLRPFNEKAAGDGGFIGVKGEEFVRGNTGEVARFWAVNVGPAVIDMPRKYVDQLARFLSKRGVNMVRLHGPLYHQSGDTAGQIDKAHLDNVFYFVAALKREGIYSYISIHFQHWIRIDKLPQFPGYDAETLPFAIHFFNDEYQKMYRTWWEALLTTQNPYTRNALSDEPAVAGVELLNEDGFFFWTFDYKRIPAQQMRILEKQFGDWLTKRHGSIQNALAKWGGQPREEDAIDAGRVGFVGIWHMGNIRDARAQDTVRFLAELQRGFFDKHYQYLKKDLGFKGVVAASNWITGSPRYLEPLDSWTNAGADFFDHHGYFDRPEKKNVQAFGFGPGDQYGDRSGIRLDPSEIGKPAAMDLPFLDVVHNGKPSMVSEYGWNNPNRFRGEMPLLASSLASLSGMDAMVLFAMDSVPQWRATETENYWPIQTPADIGQFPAAALIFRNAMVREGAAMARVNANLEDLFLLKGAPYRSGKLQDFIRAKDAPQQTAVAADAGPTIDNRYLAIGKVEMNYTDRPSSFEQGDLSKYVDVNAKSITSTNGETRWDYGKGIFHVTAARAQGTAGFLQSAGTVKLPDVTISSGMDFGSIVLVAMDGKPLAESGKILLQAMSEQQNSGWSAAGAEKSLKTIKSVGQMPIQIRALSGNITLNRPDAASLTVTALDFNGYEKAKMPKGATISLKADLPYYLIQK